MHFHAVLVDRLGEASDRADAMREEARRLLIEAAADAHQAGMTQREIASALRRSQPEVSRLLSLAVPRFKPRSELGRRLVEHRGELLDALQSRGASNIRVFGSVARGEDDERSDIDLLVDVPEGYSFRELVRLTVAAEEILGAEVDVVTSRGLPDRLRDPVTQEAMRL